MVKVLKSGFFTTIQDKGRFGYRNKGVPVSGAMDSQALDMANSLLENSDGAAAFEVTMTGPTLLFGAETYICLSGARISATLNNEPIENYKVYKINNGDIVSYGRLESGFRGYLAVKGGLKAECVLESCSQYYPLTSKRNIDEGDEINLEASTNFEPKISELKINPYLKREELTVSRGPEYDMLEDNQLEALFSKGFTVAKENNRMAYQVTEPIAGHDRSILTSATLPGTIQLTPSGKLIMLMKDGQTTGGYPRILQLTKEAVCILAQKKSGDSFHYKLT